MDLTPRPTARPPSATPADGTRSDRSRRALGARGEDLAADHLEAQGMVVLARNWRIAQGELRGELDLVVRDGDTLVIVEVKTRGSLRFGSPLDAVTREKQAKIRLLAAAFARESRLQVRQLRCDVVGIVIADGEPALTHVRGAF